VSRLTSAATSFLTRSMAENTVRRGRSPFGEAFHRRRPVGETPTGATVTVALPLFGRIVKAKRVGNFE